MKIIKVDCPIFNNLVQVSINRMFGVNQKKELVLDNTTATYIKPSLDVLCNVVGKHINENYFDGNTRVLFKVENLPFDVFPRKAHKAVNHLYFYPKRVEFMPPFGSYLAEVGIYLESDSALKSTIKHIKKSL